MYVSKRSGFAMILAIFVVVLIALGGVMLLNRVSIGVKAVEDNYIRTQAELLAESATEFAVMRAQDFNTSGGNCLNQLYITVQDSTGIHNVYDVTVNLQYSFSGAKPNNQCNTLDENTSGIITNHGAMVLVDTEVKTSVGANLSTEPIRIFKRSWQKL